MLAIAGSRRLLACFAATLIAPLSLACSSGPGSGTAAAGCTDENTTCAGPLSQRYFCTGSAKPMTSTSCTATDDAGTYCCLNTSEICALDETTSPSTVCGPIDSPSSWSVYACNGSALPFDNSNPDYACWAAPPSNGVAEYCCTTGIVDGCFRDPQVTCEGSAVAYNCLVGEQLHNLASSFSCSSGDPPLCCYTAPTFATCATLPPPTPPGTAPCQGSATAYSCPGVSIPEDTDTTIACDSGSITANAASVTFCCVPFASTACTVDHLVPSCNLPGFYGFSCTGSTRPEASDPALKCSVSNAGQYCCTRD